MTAEQMKRCLFAEMKTTTAEVELEEMLSALDLDNDGKVRMDDFLRLLATEESLMQEDSNNQNCVDKMCAIL